MQILTETTSVPETNATRIMRLPEVIAVVGIRRSAIYDAIASGTFPSPVLLGPRAIGFFSHEIEAWLQSRPRAIKSKGE